MQSRKGEPRGKVRAGAKKKDSSVSPKNDRQGGDKNREEIL